MKCAYLLIQFAEVCFVVGKHVHTRCVALLTGLVRRGLAILCCTHAHTHVYHTCIASCTCDSLLS